MTWLWWVGWCAWVAVGMVWSVWITREIRALRLSFEAEIASLWKEVGVPDAADDRSPLAEYANALFYEAKRTREVASEVRLGDKTLEGLEFALGRAEAACWELRDAIHRRRKGREE